MAMPLAHITYIITHRKLFKQVNFSAMSRALLLTLSRLRTIVSSKMDVCSHGISMKDQAETQKKNEQHGRIHERLDRYRQGMPSEGTSRAKKTARTMLFINIILIAIMFMLYKSSKEPEYYTSTLEDGTLLYRLSITRDPKSRTYITSLTIKSTAPFEKSYVFTTGTIGRLAIASEGVTVHQTTLGDNIRELRLVPGEARSYVKPLSEGPILSFAKAHPDMLTPRRRVFLFSEKQRIPLQARFSPGNEEKITATIDFRYEVK
jgi:hypothetical protein